MSDETKNDQPSNQSIEEEDEIPKEVQDWFLAELVSLSNEHGATTGVMLNVGGTVISGIIVGGAEYFREFGKEYTSGMPEDDAKKRTKEFFASYASIYERQEGEPTLGTPGYIHLKEARFLTPGQAAMPSNTTVWWRGRIAAVDGFSLGLLGRDKK